MKSGGSTHLHGGYLLRSPLLRGYLSVTDALLRALHAPGRRPSRPDAATSRPRVLLAIGGHLGDAIVASRAVQLLRDFAPNFDLGIAGPSWSRVVFEDEPAIRWHHTVDHWRLNRSATSLPSKLLRYGRTWRAARAEIESVGYDMALDLYPYYPNMAGLLWRAGIPRTFGFATGGRAILYTATAEWIDDRCHISEKQVRLLKLAFPALDGSRVPVPRLAPPANESGRIIASLLAANGIAAGAPYAILHPGAGIPARLWPVSSWRELAERLARKMAVVLTGVGPAELAAAQTIGCGLDRCLNLVDKLDWRQLEALVAGAAVVVAGETSLGHLAAAHRTPGVAIYAGITDTREWGPLGASDVPLSILSAFVPCAPCYRPEGCEEMACVRGVSVDRVASELARLLERSSTPAGEAALEKTQSSEQFHPI